MTSFKTRKQKANTTFSVTVNLQASNVSSYQHRYGCNDNNRKSKMGGDESLPRNLSEYHDNDRIGVFRFVREEGENMVEVEKQLPSERVYKQWAKGVAEVQSSVVGSDMVFLPMRESWERREVCGSGGAVRIVFEQWENFLKQEIANRRKSQNNYTQEEIWFIIYSIVQAGVFYETKNMKIGDLHPNNIVVTPQGLVKVITVHSLPNQLNNFQKIVEEIKADVYLAPEEMDSTMLENGAYSIRDPSKCDVFSLGVTILEAASLENCTYLYIRNPLRISLQKMIQLTSIVKNNYSQILYNTLLSMLAVNPQQRLSFMKLYEMLKPHEQLIYDFQPFSFSNVGSRVHENSSRKDSPGQVRKGSGTPFSPPSQTHFTPVKPQ